MNKPFCFTGTANHKVVGGYSTLSDGNMSSCYADISHFLSHRIDFLGALGIDYRALVCAKQVHGNRIGCVQEHDKGRGALKFEDSLEACDGLITDVAEVPLAVFSADCLTVFLYDPQKPAVGMVHAGWRGTKGGIVGRALDLMEERFGTQPPSVHTAFGPAIRRCCYEVGEEFLDFFPSCVTRRGRRFFFDLAKANRQQLLARGLPPRHIHDPKICTSCLPKKFFSYRREPQGCGRMMSVIMLKKI